MFKKFVAAISLWAVMSSTLALPVYAEVKPADLIVGVKLAADSNASAQTFEPSVGQILRTLITFNTDVQPPINSSGSVKVVQGSKIVKILKTWSNENIPTSIPDWNGKEIENTTDAHGICGAAGLVCPVGNYQVLTHVEYVSGADIFFDNEASDFKIFVTPAVVISNLTVPKNTFNPTLPETSDISFTTSNAGFITVEIFDVGTLVKTLIDNKSLAAGNYSKANEPTLAWDGKNSAGQLQSNKLYTIKATSRQTATGAVLDTKTTTVTIDALSTIQVTSYTVVESPLKVAGIFDPSPLGDKQSMAINYTLNKAPTSVTIDIKNSKGKIVKNFTLGSAISDVVNWDGKDSLGKIVAPGTYTAVLTPAKSGEVPTPSTKTFSVTYNHPTKGSITNLSVSPVSFDPDFEGAVIEFRNTVGAEITVTIEDASGNILRAFSEYDSSLRSANTLNSVRWDGKNTGGSIISLGTYKVVVVTRNEYGVVIDESKTVAVVDTGVFLVDSNNHIAGISFSPSTTFEPGKDDQLKIEFDAKVKLDSLQIFAVRGATKIELYNEQNVVAENNLEVTWDGTDSSGDYVPTGSWRIEFSSKVGITPLIAAKTISIDYDKPKINDLELSKSKIDNERGEFTNILFRVDKEASIDIKVLNNGQEDDDIVEDMEVNANQWYAVQWDGRGSNYDDNIDLRLTAANKYNTDVFESKKIKLDLAEDGLVTNRANIINDSLDPAITSGNDEMVLSYFLDDYGDVQISILKGNTTSGSTVITLADIENQEPGDHEVKWNGKDNNGKKLPSGFYTYKIISKKSSTDTETGLFVVGNVGDSVSSSGSTSGSGSKTSGKVSSNVVIDGGKDEDIVEEDEPEEKPSGSAFAKCANFTDVTIKNDYCQAITWVKEQGIFRGYGDGSFGVNSPIQRVELLKVIMEALDIKTQATSGTAGFIDVVAGQWYMPYVQGGKNFGIFNGDAGKGTARPHDSSQRVEALKMIFESMRTAGKISQIGVQCSVTHPDVMRTVWYAKYVCEADNLDLYDVGEGEIFGTNTLSTRGEVAEVLYRLHLRELF